MKIERLREEIQKGIDSADRDECVKGREFMTVLISRASGRNVQMGSLAKRKEEVTEQENEL